MIYYQVQLQKLDGTWDAYGEATPDQDEGRKKYFEFLTGFRTKEYRAVRLTSVWQCWDKTWRVKEVIDYKDLS